MARFKVNDRVIVVSAETVSRGLLGLVVSSGGDDGTYYGVMLEGDTKAMGFSEYELERVVTKALPDGWITDRPPVYGDCEESSGSCVQVTHLDRG
mgnify:CR=1 FL=1